MTAAAGRRLMPKAKRHIEFVTELRGELAEKFLAVAERRQVRPVDLAADILETVIKDNLFAAVLDG